MSALSSVGSNASELMMIPANAAAELAGGGAAGSAAAATAARLARDIASPPTMMPAIASAGAASRNTGPNADSSDMTTPRAMHASESTPSTIDNAAMRGRFGFARAAVNPAGASPRARARALVHIAATLRPMSSSEARSGRCAIVGRANVGKSTLLNALLGQKLAIATAKPQTTRNCILGLYTRAEPPLQIAFVDTPGMHAPENALGRALLEQAKAGLVDADVIVLMAQVSARPALSEVLGPHERELMQIAKRDGKPLILAINKVDRVADKPLLLPVLQQCADTQAFAALVPLCARKGTGLPALIDEVAARLPEGLRYDPELLTDKPERFFAAELVREAVIRNTRQELPYSIAVSIEEFTDTERLCSISAVVVVSKDAHKGIVIGKGGQRLKTIGSEARAEMETMLQRKVFLKLWVVVTPDWIENPERVRELLTRDAEAVSSP